MLKFPFGRKQLFFEKITRLQLAALSITLSISSATIALTPRLAI
jgi:hypothetical protein